MLTLRTGCTGGALFDQGAHAANYTSIDGWEIDPAKAAIARLNGVPCHAADVCAVDWAALPPADHRHDSPSCKTASQANPDGGEAAEDLAVADAIARGIHAHAAQGGRSYSLENVWGYRSFESFRRILAALAESGFVATFDHVNAANYGVPQTRKRLILRAVHRSWRGRVPPLHPTHRRGGDMFSPPWVGWYAAIEDLIPSLTPTRPAPWQLKRLPKELRESLLIGAGGYDGQIVTRPADAPSFTLAHGGRGDQGNAGQIRAYLVGGGNTGDAIVSSHARPTDAPAFTVRGEGGSPDRALLISSNSGPGMWGNNHREADEPAQTMTTNAEGRARALLLDPGTDPAFTLRAGRADAHRAYVGRWVLLDIRCLGRFQTVPDSYQGLTAEINGNGVPCLLAQRIMESFQ